jgi:hypothetical protein
MRTDIDFASASTLMRQPPYPPVLLASLSPSSSKFSVVKAPESVGGKIMKLRVSTRAGLRGDVNGDGGAFSCEKNGPRPGCRAGNGLAALEHLAGPEIVPMRAERQIDLSMDVPRLDHRRSEQRWADHHLVTLPPAVRIVGKVEEGRPDHGLVGVVVAPEQVIKVGGRGGVRFSAFACDTKQCSAPH